MNSVKGFWLEVYKLSKKEQDLHIMSYRVLTRMEDIMERHAWLNLSLNPNSESKYIGDLLEIPKE